MRFYFYNQNTLEVLESQEFQSKYNAPRNTFTFEPLPGKDGYVVCVCDFVDGLPTSTEYIEDHRGKTIYDKSDCTKSKQVEELGKIEDGWTLDEPTTMYDEWTDGKWVTNLQNQYEAQVLLVSNSREILYKEQVDRLRNEAASIRRVDGDETTAEEYEAQADAAYLKIREDNPWPENPASTSESETSSS